MIEKKANFLDLNDSIIISKKTELHLNNIEQDDNEKIEIKIIPFKKYFLKIFIGKKQNYYYILDRLKYDINTIMMLLDLNKINKLSEVFKEYEDGIEKIIFITRMKAE